MSIKNGILKYIFIASMLLTAFNCMAVENQNYSGVEINVVTFDGPQVLEPLKRRAGEFEKLSGVKVNVNSVPFPDLYEKIRSDWSQKKPNIDGAIFLPQWMPDFVIQGYLENITNRIFADGNLRSKDIAPFFSAVSQKYGSQTYLISLDGDFHLLYYRKDILKKINKEPPKTWDEYLEIAQITHGQDYGGGAVYGSCISKKKSAQSYWMITSIAAPYLQSKGTQEGVFFNRGNMFPLVNNEGFSRALEIYKLSTKFGPPNENQLDVGDTRRLFIGGQCVLTVDWGDIGPLAANPEKSKVVDRVGVSILPGSRSVVDRATDKLVLCSADRCPFAKSGINYAPFAAAGGWSAGIAANSTNARKNATFALFSYMSRPGQSNVDVTRGETGFNPYRFSQFRELDPWIKAGMSADAAKIYLEAIQESLYSPNMVLDLRIPSNQVYQQVILDNAISRFLEGSMDSGAAIKYIEEGWNRQTDQLGRAAQLKETLQESPSAVVGNKHHAL